jgi:hypothetical protein
MEKKMVDINNLYGDSFKDFQELKKSYTKEELALIIMKKEEEIWDLISELDTKTNDLVMYKIPPYYEESEEE